MGVAPLSWDCFGETIGLGCGPRCLGRASHQLIVEG